MVMAASAFIGAGARKRLADRVAELERLRWETAGLRARIGGCRLDLEDCFAASGLFAPAAEGLRAGLGPARAIEACGLRARGLELFAAGLEAETVEGQLENIDIFADSLDADLAAARDDLSKKGRLYLGLSILCGAAVCVILS